MSITTSAELPVFPLPGVVLLPNSVLPLHIFESRYRQMLADVMAGDQKFMILNSQGKSKAPHQIGCIAEVLRTEKLDDGRSNILTVGRERARIIEYFGDKPYLLARVEFLKDAEKTATAATVDKLKDDLNQLSRLTSKLYGRDANEILIADLDPEELSFIVAGLIVSDPGEQQKMLEMEQTADRIELLAVKLQSMSKKMAAIAAIEEAFSSQ